MIRDLFTSLGRMARWGIVFTTFMSIVGLMIVGSKIGSWVTDTQQVSRAAALDSREAELRAAERVAMEKREAAVVERETSTVATLEKMRAERDQLRSELERIRSDTAKAVSENRAANAAVAATRKKVADAEAKLADDSTRWKLVWAGVDGKRFELAQLYTTRATCTSAAVAANALPAGAITFDCFPIPV